jgi:conflict system STAND superfamily ATPase
MPGLEELGWLQFERLCELVLEADAGVDPTRWEGSADTTRHVVCDNELRIGDRTFSPPVLVRCCWQRDDHVAAPPNGFASVVTFANHPAAEIGNLVYGEHELRDAIRRLPALRLKLPSILSLEAAPPDEQALARSTFDVDTTRELARVFVPTPAWSRAVATLKAHNFLVLTGPPEMGKTAIARMLGLELLTEGWEVHETTRPEQVEKLFDRSKPQLFIADDAFGSTEYRPDAAERWANNLDRILRATDAHHWLVWTSRPAPLRAGLRRLHRERGGEQFPQPAAVQVDASALGVEEKTLILFRHARAAHLSRRQCALVREHGAEIVAHPHFTPERIRRFVARGAPVDDVERELTEPTEAMAASYGALEREHRELLYAMLDSPPGPVAERDLAAGLRRHATSGLQKAPADLVDRLADHFLRVIA